MKSNLRTSEAYGGLQFSGAVSFLETPEKAGRCEKLDFTSSDLLLVLPFGVRLIKVKRCLLESGVALSRGSVEWLSLS